MEWLERNPVRDNAEFQGTKKLDSAMCWKGEE
jgi:hypothetical protein